MAEQVRDFSELKSTLIKAPEPEVEAEVAALESKPKIDKQGEQVADFALHGPKTHGIPRLVALYGIESPGLTASLAIADHVAGLIV